MIANRRRMMKFTLRFAIVIATVALAVLPGLVSDEGSRATDAPGPYVLTDLGTLEVSVPTRTTSTMPARSSGIDDRRE